MAAGGLLALEMTNKLIARRNPLQKTINYHYNPKRPRRYWLFHAICGDLPL